MAGRRSEGRRAGPQIGLAQKAGVRDVSVFEISATSLKSSYAARRPSPATATETGATAPGNASCTTITVHHTIGVGDPNRQRACGWCHSTNVGLIIGLKINAAFSNFCAVDDKQYFSRIVRRQAESYFQCKILDIAKCRD